MRLFRTNRAYNEATSAFFVPPTASNPDMYITTAFFSAPVATEASFVTAHDRRSTVAPLAHVEVIQDIDEDLFDEGDRTRDEYCGSISPVAIANASRSNRIS